MAMIGLLECMQEVSSFNPIESTYDAFEIQRGAELLDQRTSRSAIAGALTVLEGDHRILPIYSARAGSAGPLSEAGWHRLRKELLDAAAAAIPAVDGLFVSLHGAMAAVGEPDPEGNLLQALREMGGPDMPIVASLDLHGIMTPRMLAQLDAFAVYHTYPHVDFFETGQRAARLLQSIRVGTVRPVTARVTIPALVRGDELITKTGYYGELIAECRALERNGDALAASIMIGNPFTDVPELCSQVLVTTDGDRKRAAAEAVRLAHAFWNERWRMQSRVVPLTTMAPLLRAAEGTCILVDAADATSSGASGDSNAILKALLSDEYPGRVLAQIVDAPAAGAAHQAGVGSTVQIHVGGALDSRRFTPMAIEARVKLLTDGQAVLERARTAINAGRSAVLEFRNVTLVVLSRTVSLFDRSLYYSHGLDPEDFDAVVVKSPHTEYHMYQQWASRTVNVDAPGATSANLRSLGHSACRRPMFPLDEGVAFDPEVASFGRG